MAKLLQGILGGISGGVGNVVGGSWKGIAYIRTYPLSVSQPNTAAQLTQRSKMTEAVAFAKLFLVKIIKPLNDRFAVHMSGYNLFIQRNVALFDGLPAVYLPLVVFSEGSLTGVENLEAVGANADADVTVTWDDNSGTGTAVASDVAYIACYIDDASGPIYGASNASDLRSDATATVTLSANATTADIIYCYMSFRSANGFSVSNTSFYLETVP